MKMKLGWWRDRMGRDHEVVRKWDDAFIYPWTSSGIESWNDNGRYLGDHKEDPLDLIEFLRPLESEIPPALNSAVKAAEDMVRRLERHHAALRNQANEAWEILTQAKRELERLEKECEVKP